MVQVTIHHSPRNKLIEIPHFLSISGIEVKTEKYSQELLIFSFEILHTKVHSLIFGF